MSKVSVIRPVNAIGWLVKGAISDPFLLNLVLFCLLRGDTCQEQENKMFSDGEPKDPIYMNMEAKVWPCFIL